LLEVKNTSQNLLCEKSLPHMAFSCQILRYFEPKNKSSVLIHSTLVLWKQDRHVSDLSLPLHPRQTKRNKMHSEILMIL